MTGNQAYALSRKYTEESLKERVLLKEKVLTK